MNSRPYQATRRTPLPIGRTISLSTQGSLRTPTDLGRVELKVHDEMGSLEVLLTFLWASEQGLLTSVTLSDIEESPQLNHQCELIIRNIRKLDTPQTGSALDPAGGLAMATESLMLSMQQRESTRLLERA